MMNATHLMEDFVKADLWDIALPYQRNFLPPTLSPEQKEAFLAKQHAVLSKEANGIEGGPKMPHANLATSADAYLEVLAHLDSGGHGIVGKIKVKVSKKVYARKTLQLSDIGLEPSALKNFNDEIQLLKRPSYHHRVRYVGSYTDPKRLSSILQEQRCHHKDIKPGNILVKAGKVFITDFGIANDWSDKTRSTATGQILSFSLPYAAPQVLDFKPRNTASDMWSLGCVYLDMVAVLNGEGLETRNQFFEVTGTGAPSPTNQEAYKQWVKQLKASSDEKPLE
ncbi:uncharacterized protein Z519_08058 [Cladophialophora bantiana CBS 173.52]|uniref:Protein kinase domain-containing protein n=1 Tax=Cladophialophora bantiana (strain ATCC 10958 / CBS 173.52 / CDC B-1940 / NIH 8579) TaxID=1442370 RepID=A0A0D2HCZ3_CLAB1|nr:uncharacterized protein Z519_08058 [Cladophialophora bantiana CBS 173.52]KIW91163.1 hypothetical protein Z519_08058 [Cladophialophora bantiana CBS 173.52]